MTSILNSDDEFEDFEEKSFEPYDETLFQKGIGFVKNIFSMRWILLFYVYIFFAFGDN